MIYSYKGISVDGQTVSGTITARQPAQALEMLVQRGITAHDLRETRQRQRRLKTSRPKGADQAQLIQQLAVLLGSGIELLDALDSLKRNVEHERFAVAIDEIRATLRQGGSLSEGLRAHLPELPRSVPTLVGLGERTGRLADTLEILARQLSQREELRAELRSALSYPIFLLCVGVAAVVFLFGVVVPRFSNMLGERQNDLEGMAAAVFAISDAMREHTTLGAVLVAVFVGAGLYAWRSPRGRAYALRLVHQAPGLGRWMRQVEIANWTRLMGIALQSRANLLESVGLARHAVTSPRNRAAFDDVARDLRAGATLDDALAKVPDLEPVVLNLVATGARAGKLGDMLMLATDILDTRTRRTADRFGRLAEPAAILIISALVGVVVISLVTAMTSIYDIGMV